jgi:hypothetical protein
VSARLAVCGLLLLAFGGSAVAAEGQIIEATTTAGEKVRLLPKGRWEFVNAARQEEAQRVAESYPENQVCPPGAQGRVLGIGRCILPGDPDYNRGSRSPKTR